VKSVELLRLVFDTQERTQKYEKEIENLKNDTRAMIEKIEANYDALTVDLGTLNQKK